MLSHRCCSTIRHCIPPLTFALLLYTHPSIQCFLLSIRDAELPVGVAALKGPKEERKVRRGAVSEPVTSRAQEPKPQPRRSHAGAPPRHAYVQWHGVPKGTEKEVRSEAWRVPERQLRNPLQRLAKARERKDQTSPGTAGAQHAGVVRERKHQTSPGAATQG